MCERMIRFASGTQLVTLLLASREVCNTINCDYVIDTVDVHYHAIWNMTLLAGKHSERTSRDSAMLIFHKMTMHGGVYSIPYTQYVRSNDVG